MSLQFENSLLNVWFEGSHRAGTLELDAEAKSKAMTNRDQVLAVVQALQQCEAIGTSRAPAEPMNEVARAFLLSSPNPNARTSLCPPPDTGIRPDPPRSARMPSITAQSAGIPPSTATKDTISPTASPSAGIPPSAKQYARTPPDFTRNTANPPSSSQSATIRDCGAANDSLIKSRYAATILRVARTSDRETAARLVRGISRDLPLDSEIPEIANFHRCAIIVFDQLATSLVDASRPQQQFLWKAALDAVAEWLGAVQSDNAAA
jgi:hypothetical protein